MKTNPSTIVTIIMATYNRAHLIKESIETIMNQSYEEWECLIIDDGSTDETKEILEPYIKRDERFKYYNRGMSHKKGLPGCRNTGLELAKGKFIVFFDDDDIPHPDCLKWCVEEITKNNADYCRFLRTVFFKVLNKNFDRHQDYIITAHNQLPVEAMITGNVPFNSCQVLWKKEYFENEKFNEDLMFAEEWELYTRLLLKQPNGITVEKNLYFGRKHDASNTGEFKQANSIRIDSKIQAARLIINHTARVGKFSRKLIKFFIRMGFDLKSYHLLNEVLKKSDMATLKKLKYRLGFKFYPLIKPFLKLKGGLKST